MNRRPIVHLLALAAAACTVGPDYEAPKPSLPAAWREATGHAAGMLLGDGYWRAFGDPQLDALVERAIAGNPDVAIARARTAEACLRAAAAGSERWPQVDLDGLYNHSRLSEHGFLEGLATGSPGGGGGGGAVFPGQEIGIYQAGVGASWELDLFGARRRDVEASEADAEAADAEANGVLQALCASVVEQYLQWAANREQLALAQQTLQIAQRERDVLRERATAGLADERDLARADLDTAKAEARVQQLTAETQASEYGLEVLLGAQPGELAATPPAMLPPPPDAFAVDVPAAVLAHRPDVRAAERRLGAATARIGIATADLYPRLSLTGAFGLQAQDLGDLPKYESRFWAVGPAVRWPLFDFGRVRSRIDVADARTHAALAGYEGTVHQALADVEVALVRLARGRETTAALQRASEAAHTQRQLVQEQYDQGVGEFVDVLDAERDAAMADGELLRAREALARGFVGLGKALGGGWPRG